MPSIKRWEPGWRTQALWLVLLTLSAGCGGSGSTVAAKVTLDGVPLADADVTLHPTEGGGLKGSSYAGKTKNDGTLNLRLPPTSPGVVPGSYKVTVTRVELKQGAKVPDGLKNDPGQLQAMGLLTNSLPRQYADAAKTPLKLEVKPGSNASVTLEVSSK